MKLTQEQLVMFTKAMKEGKDVNVLFNAVFSISIHRTQNVFSFGSLKDSGAEALVANELPYYDVELNLVDSETEELLANVAYMKLRLAPYYGDGMIDAEDLMDNDVDSASATGYLMGLDIELSDYMDDYFNRFNNGIICYGELHTFYVFPEFRGTGVASYLLDNINYFLRRDFGRVIFLLGAYINPFKNPVTLDQIKNEEFEYSRDNNPNSELCKPIYRMLEKNNFIAGRSETGVYYKIMFASNDDFDYDDFDDEE